MPNNRVLNINTAAESGTFIIGGDIPVYRLGFGAMRITGSGVWGPPENHGEAIAVLRRCVELGVNLIDTAESYGPWVSEELIAEALYPYPQGLLMPPRAVLTGRGLARGRRTAGPSGCVTPSRAACDA